MRDSEDCAELGRRDSRSCRDGSTRSSGAKLHGNDDDRDYGRPSVLMSRPVDRSTRSRIKATILGVVLGSTLIGAYLMLRGEQKVASFNRTTESAAQLLEENAKSRGET